MSAAADTTARSRPDVRPLSITHLTTFYPPFNFGGDGIHVQRLARAQSERGHRVRVIHAPGAHRLLKRSGGSSVSTDDGDATDDDGVEVRALPAAGGLEPFLVHQLGRPILSRARLEQWLTDAANPPDVIHFHNVSLVGGPFAFRLGNAVKLATCHEYWLRCPTHMLFRYDRELCTRRTCIRCTLRSGRPPQWWRYTAAVDRGLAHVDRLIFPSRTTRDVYRAQGIEAPAAVLPHFLPDREIRAATALGRRRSDAPPYLLYVGRLDAVKGIDRLLEAFVEGERGTELRIAGDGPLRGRLQARYDGSPGVRFLGVRTGDELGKLYRDAVALILPSAGYEVFGQVVAEGFAHGTPAIVTETGAGRELVEASGAGIVYRSRQELEAAITLLTDRSDRRDEMGERGRTFVAGDLSEARYMERYEELVRECVR